MDRLERRLAALAPTMARDPRGIPMTGAAGGLAGGLWAACGARLVAGAPFVLDAVGFDDRLRRAALVVTGEGRLDATTVEGKVVSEVARRARAAGIPAHAVVGEDATGPADRAALGLASIRQAGTPGAIAAAGAAIARSLSRAAAGR